MLQVTERATDVLQQALTAQEIDGDQAVRLTPDGEGGVGLHIGPIQPGDEVVSRDEQPVLAVDPQVAGHLTGFVLDYTEGDGNGVGPAFVLDRAG